MSVSFEIASVKNEFTCRFMVDGRTNYDERGTDGTGIKFYSTEQKALEAGKRYIKRMQAAGFSV